MNQADEKPYLYVAFALVFTPGKRTSKATYFPENILFKFLYVLDKGRTVTKDIGCLRTAQNVSSYVFLINLNQLALSIEANRLLFLFTLGPWADFSLSIIG